MDSEEVNHKLFTIINMLDPCVPVYLDNDFKEDHINFINAYFELNMTMDDIKSIETLNDLTKYIHSLLSKD